MANQEQVYEVVKELGFNPIEDRAIIVRFTPENLSGKVRNFFAINNYYTLQLCEGKILIVPITLQMSKWGYGNFKPSADDVLVISNESIKAIEMEEDGLNYTLTLKLEDQDICLTVQQKELSSLRSSGALGVNATFWTMKMDNFHKKNFDHTINDLKAMVTQ